MVNPVLQSGGKYNVDVLNAAVYVPVALCSSCGHAGCVSWISSVVALATHARALTERSPLNDCVWAVVRTFNVVLVRIVRLPSRAVLGSGVRPPIFLRVVGQLGMLGVCGRADENSLVIVLWLLCLGICGCCVSEFVPCVFRDEGTLQFDVVLFSVGSRYSVRVLAAGGTATYLFSFCRPLSCFKSPTRSVFCAFFLNVGALDMAWLVFVRPGAIELQRMCGCVL
jgi:hypothetical protein